MELKENEIQLSDEGKIYKVKPVKLKYMKDDFYNNYMLLRKLGIKIFKFTDTSDNVKDFLRAVMDIEDIDGIYDDLDVPTLIRIVEITKKINGIEDEAEIKNDQAMETEKE